MQKFTAGSRDDTSLLFAKTATLKTPAMSVGGLHLLPNRKIGMIYRLLWFTCFKFTSFRGLYDRFEHSARPRS